MSRERVKELREKHVAGIKSAQEDMVAQRDGAGYDADAQSAFQRAFDAAMDLKTEADDLEKTLNATEAGEQAVTEARTAAAEGASQRQAANFANSPVIETDPKGPTDPAEVVAIEKSAFTKRMRQWAGFDITPYTKWEKRSLLPTARQAPTDSRAFSHYDIPLEQRAAQQTSTDGVGGDFIPRGFLAEILVQQQAFGGMRRVARILQTDSGAPMDYPFSDDVSASAAIVAEATTGGTTEIVTGNNVLEAAKYTSGVLKYSIELAGDSAFNVSEWIQGNLAARFGRGTEAHFATRSSTEGSGPHGITNETSTAGSVQIAQFVPSAGSSNFYGALTALIHAVDPAYRESANAAIMMHDRSLLGLSASVDGNNRPLWEPDMQVPGPGRFRGIPIVVNQHLTDISSTNSAVTLAIWYGAWEHYLIRDSMGMTMFPLRERFMNEGNFGVIAFSRVDGRATFATTTPALKPIQCLAGTT